MSGRLLAGRLVRLGPSPLSLHRCVANSTSCTAQPAQTATAASRPLLWLLLAAGGSVAAHVLTGRDRSRAEAIPAGGTRDAMHGLERLKQWLKEQGMDMDVVEVKQSQAGPGAGLGMFVSDSASLKKLRQCMLPAHSRRWWWPFGSHSGDVDKQQPLLTLPLSAAITAANILQDPALGRGYAWMLDRGLVDQRTIVMTYLVIERLKGQASKIAPWIDALPQTFDTPIMFSPEVLEELRGTPLHHAQAIVRSRLADLWKRMQPAIQGLLEGQAGVTRQATFDDLLWAYSVFWSRGQTLPVPTKPGVSTSRLLASDPQADAHALLEVQEGIVPGLDFCNHHSTAPLCWWEVIVPRSGPQASGTSPAGHAASAASDANTIGSGQRLPALVQLRLHAGSKVKPGDELMISYGDKSNEELLMLYGFAVPGNPHDHIMLHCPLPPASAWDNVMHARMELIRARRHDLQFFLPSSTASQPISLPQRMLNTLEVFTMTPQEVAAALQAAEDGSGAEVLPTPIDLKALRKRKASMSSADLRVTSERLGLYLGACATLVKMLEARIEEQEGEQGTGMLEADQQLLQAAHGLVMDTPAQRQRHACVIYRCEQKRIAQEYLRLARAELQDVMSLMQELNDGGGAK